MYTPALSALASLLLAGFAEGESSSVQNSAPAAAISAPVLPWVALVTALAWPVAAFAIAFVFRTPLGNFLSGVAGRVTKLSAFKVALELATAPSAAAGPLLDDIRSATTLANVSDSTRMMLEQAQSTLPADYAVIDLGSGDEWLTSRLFIAAVMLERMRGAKSFVFLESTSTVARRFIAIGSITEVRWALAMKYPWLEDAWLRAYATVFPTYTPSATPAGTTLPPGAAWLSDPLTINPAPSPIQSVTGALESWTARAVVGQFIQMLQIPGAVAQFPPQPNPVPGITGPASVTSPVMVGSSTVPGDTWVTFASGTQERATWVTRQMLEAMLPAAAFELWADEARDAPRSKRTRGVLRTHGPFVALVRGDREYVRLVNRTSLLEEMASSFGEEPE